MTIGSDVWRRVRSVVEGALDLQGAARLEYVAGTCGTDRELREQVERLLASHDRAATFLEEPALTITEPVVGDLTGQMFGSYRIESRLGAGGMGVVYKAYDSRLNRPVALKLLPTYMAHDDARLQRFHAEVRAASSLNHPNILVVHDFAEHEGLPFMITEFVAGRTLRDRLRDGPLGGPELLDVARQVASALAAAHESGVLHRDIKPENVMVRPDGYVKVVDFGLAKLLALDEPSAGPHDTRHGFIVGTPQYMSPEQARAEPLDFRSDLFSFGTLLYELATGLSPFAKSSAIESAAAVISQEPLPLEQASPHLPRVLCGIVSRCLSKKPGDRPASTRELYRELGTIDPFAAPGTQSRHLDSARDTVVVLPLKVLRGRPDAEFLAFSLPDAIAATLAERPTIAVRSPRAVQRHGGADADLSALADVMGARFALTGTLTCLDDRIAVRVQLLAIPSGTVMWSSSRVATAQELFDLQDAVAHHVADALPISTSAERREAQGQRERDVPADPGAYAFYLRANQLAYEANHWQEARALYRECVGADPQYAPAWARLARCERLIGKYSVSAAETRSCLERAEEFFQRALALNPDLPIAHAFYSQLLIDVGRAQDAMERLLARAARHPLDADVYAGLVHALRFCGLLDASVAAHRQTKRLDPTAPTSVHHTWWMKGEYDQALRETFGDIGYMQGLALASQGREREAVAALRWRERETTETRIRPYLTSLRALLEGDRETCLSAVIEATALPVDAEALFYLARTLARLGESDRAAAELARVVEGGFWCADTFARDPWLDTLRGRDDVQRTLKRAAEHVDEAARRFARAGGFDLIHTTHIER